ncbi:hypothetical protein J6590_097177 [Homalodisca vitripennis]|nr:hypothetical protein J6590_097177 [Homalodisca vitripennis]
MFQRKQYYESYHYNVYSNSTSDRKHPLVSTLESKLEITAVASVATAAKSTGSPMAGSANVKVYRQSAMRPLPKQ